MFLVRNYVRNVEYAKVIRQSFNNYVSNATNNQIAKPLLRKKSKSKEIGPLGWLLLSVPAATFCLGTWQVQRKKWKEGLIHDLKTRTQSDPIQLPNNLEDVNQFEYNPIHVKGTFLHDKELYMGPRTLLQHGDSATESALVSRNQNKSQGYLVITPLKLSDRNEVILINRGWVPAKKKNPNTRQNGQIKGEVDIIGLVRLHENRPQFMPSNKPEGNSWFYRNLNEMSKVTGAQPVYLDATNDMDVDGGPIGGQTRISLRNEHFSYILTWYSLSGLTSYMWYMKFLRSK